MKQYLLLLRSSDFIKNGNIWTSNPINLYSNSQYKNYSYIRSAYGLDLIGDRTYVGTEVTSPNPTGTHSTPFSSNVIYQTDSGEIVYEPATPSVKRFIDTSSRIDVLSYRHIFTNLPGDIIPTFNLVVYESDEQSGPWLLSSISADSNVIFIKDSKPFIKLELEISAEDLDISNIGLIFYLEIGIHDTSSPVISKSVKNVLKRFPTWTDIFSDSVDDATPSLQIPNSVGGKFINSLMQENLDNFASDIDINNINSYITSADENMLAWIYVSYNVPQNVTRAIGDSIELSRVTSFSALLQGRSTDYSFFYNPIDRQFITLRSFGSLVINDISYNQEPLNIFNDFDEFGSRVALPRLYLESNSNYKKRILDVTQNLPGVSLDALKRTLRRELDIWRAYGATPDSNYLGATPDILEISDIENSTPYFNYSGIPQREFKTLVKNLNTKYPMNWGYVKWGEGIWDYAGRLGEGVARIPAIYDDNFSQLSEFYQPGVGDYDDARIVLSPNEAATTSFTGSIEVSGIKQIASTKIYPAVVVNYSWYANYLAQVPDYDASKVGVALVYEISLYPHDNYPTPSTFYANLNYSNRSDFYVGNNFFKNSPASPESSFIRLFGDEGRSLDEVIFRDKVYNERYYNSRLGSGINNLSLYDAASINIYFGRQWTGSTYSTISASNYRVSFANATPSFFVNPVAGNSISMASPNIGRRNANLLIGSNLYATKSQSFNTDLYQNQLILNRSNDETFNSVSPATINTADLVKTIIYPHSSATPQFLYVNANTVNGYTIYGNPTAIATPLQGGYAVHQIEDTTYLVPSSPNIQVQPFNVSNVSTGPLAYFNSSTINFSSTPYYLKVNTANGGAYPFTKENYEPFVGKTNKDFYDGFIDKNDIVYKDIEEYNNSFNTSFDQFLEKVYLDRNSLNLDPETNYVVNSIKFLSTPNYIDVFTADEDSSINNLNTYLASSKQSNYLSFPGITGNYAKISDSSQLQLAGDLEIVCRINLNTFNTQMYLVTKYVSTAVGGYGLRLLSNGYLSLVWANGTASGTHTPNQTLAAAGLVPGKNYWIKATLDIDNGSGQSVGRYYWADDQATEPTTWNEFTAGTPTSGVTTILKNPSYQLGIGSWYSGTADPFNGRFYRAILRNGINGSTVLDVDFTKGLTSQNQNFFIESSSYKATVDIIRTSSFPRVENIIFETDKAELDLYASRDDLLRDKYSVGINSGWVYVKESDQYIYINPESATYNGRFFDITLPSEPTNKAPFIAKVGSAEYRNIVFEDTATPGKATFWNTEIVEGNQGRSLYLAYDNVSNISVSDTYNGKSLFKNLSTSTNIISPFSASTPAVQGREYEVVYYVNNAFYVDKDVYNESTDQYQSKVFFSTTPSINTNYYLTYEKERENNTVDTDLSLNQVDLSVNEGFIYLSKDTFNFSHIDSYLSPGSISDSTDDLMYLTLVSYDVNGNFKPNQTFKIYGASISPQNQFLTTNDNGLATTTLKYSKTNYLSLTGSAGYVNIPDSTDVSIVGDMEIVARLSLNNWISASNNAIVGKWGSTGDISYLFNIATNGRPVLWTSLDGTNVSNATTTVVPPFIDGDTYWIKVTLDADNGSGTRSATFYYSLDQADEPIDWIQIGATIPFGTAGSTYDSSTALNIGSFNGGSTYIANGKFYRVIMRNGINGYKVLDVDFSIQNPSVTSFTDKTNKTVTLSGQNAKLINGTKNIDSIKIDGVSLNSIYSNSNSQTSGYQKTLSFDILRNISYGLKVRAVPGVLHSKSGDSNVIGFAGVVEWNDRPFEHVVNLKWRKGRTLYEVFNTASSNFISTKADGTFSVSESIVSQSSNDPGHWLLAVEITDSTSTISSLLASDGESISSSDITISGDIVYWNEQYDNERYNNEQLKLPYTFRHGLQVNSQVLATPNFVYRHYDSMGLSRVGSTPNWIPPKWIPMRKFDQYQMGLFGTTPNYISDFSQIHPDSGEE